MNFSTKSEHQSQTCPGVSFKLKKLSHGRRVRIDGILAAHRIRVRELASRFNDSLKDPSAEFERMSLDQDIQMVIEKEFKPTYLREALVSLDGLELDGAPATVESLLEDGPADLVNEIYDAIQDGIGLTGEEKNESGQVSISDGPEAMPTNDMTVEPVSEKASS